MTAPITPTETLLQAFPALIELEERGRALLSSHLSLVSIPAGEAAFREGQACSAYVMVLDGAVRVQKVSETGREITLYRVERGQTCVLTTACLMSQTDYGAEGLAEAQVEAGVLSLSAFQILLAESPVFRAFVFSSYASRIGDLMVLIEEVTFGRIETRLAERLLSLAGDGKDIKTTHQALAVELGTAREVISRQLKDFERKGWLALSRGRITFSDRAALERLSG